MAGDIQEGIYWQKKAVPRTFYKLVLLKPAPGLPTVALRDHLKRLWDLWQALRTGVVASLGPDYPVDASGLEILLGYGQRFFERTDLVRTRPEGMSQRWQFSEPEPPGSAIAPGVGIRYDLDILANPANQEIAVQFTGKTPLAVHRAQVETWKYLYGARNRDTGTLPLSLAATYDGFAREDRRSWIDFHDGISNLRKGEERRQVIAIKPDNAGGQTWTLNGTYMIFMRLPVDLEVWQALPDAVQEVLVGRTKRSGCPLTGVDAGVPVPDARCPVAGTREVTDPGNEMFREPSAGVSDEIKQSHVQRANHHRPPVFRPDSRRIYRQGTEFLEPADNGRGFRAGLNFVSFQDGPERTFGILTQTDWLGQINFGGDPASQSSAIGQIISARAAGTFFVPPTAPSGDLPGTDMFPS